MSNNVFEIQRVQNININIIVSKPTLKRMPLKVIQDEDISVVCSPARKKTAINSPSLTCSEKIQKKPTTPETKPVQSIAFYEHSKNITDYKIDLDASLINLKGILVRHDIPSKLRARMVDWMVEVMSMFSKNLESLFLSVHIMDRYMQGCDKPLCGEDIHLIGIVSMMIASKLMDKLPIEMQDSFIYIGREKFNIPQIKDMQIHICKILKWNLWVPTILEEIRVIVAQIEQSLISGTKEEIKLRLILDAILVNAQKAALIGLYDSNFLQEFQGEKIAEGCIITGMMKVHKVMAHHASSITKWEKWFKGKCSVSDRVISELVRIERKMNELNLQNFEKYNFVQ